MELRLRKLSGGKARHVPRKPRTQTQVAISGTDTPGFCWEHLRTCGHKSKVTPELHPQQGMRQSPIAGVVLANVDLDHVRSDCSCCANFNRSASTPPLRFAAFSAKIIPCSACCSEFQTRLPGAILLPETHFHYATRKARIPAFFAGPCPSATHYPAYVTAERQSQLSPGEASLGFFIDSQNNDLRNTDRQKTDPQKSDSQVILPLRAWHTCPPSQSERRTTSRTRSL